jgi:MFS family permease
MAFMGLLPSFGSEMSRQGGGEAYGLLMTAVGLGSAAGPLALAAFAHRANERRLLVAVALLSGVALAALGGAGTLGVAAALAVTVGASQALFMVLLYKQTQGMSAASMRGRVASFTFFFTAGVMGIFNLGFGALATVVPPGAVMEAMGLAFVASSLALVQRVPTLRWTPPEPRSDALPASGRP